MKYALKVDGQTFEVEIDDINTRPVIARVDGQEFEITPESGGAGAGRPVPAAALPSRSNLSGKVLAAPLPGVVLELFVKPGENVEAGQVLLVIEAMKMKNSIRSVRDGTVAVVHVTPGQAVAHKQALLEFVE